MLLTGLKTAHSVWFSLHDILGREIYRNSKKIISVRLIVEQQGGLLLYNSYITIVIVSHLKAVPTVFHPGIPHGCQGFRCRSHHQLYPRKALRGSWDTSWHFYMGCEHLNSFISSIVLKHKSACQLTLRPLNSMKEFTIILKVYVIFLKERSKNVRLM